MIDSRDFPDARHAVVFDIDGTLLHSADVDDRLYRDAVRAVLGPVRFRPTLADYDPVTDSGILAQVLSDNALPSEPGGTGRVKAAFVAAFRSHIASFGAFSEIPGAKAFISALRESDSHAVAIATGGWRETAMLKLESAGFDIGGVPLATSDDAPERSEIMRLALSRLGDRFDSITYYGDGPWDEAACRQLGWRFVAVGDAIGGIASYDGIGIPA